MEPPRPGPGHVTFHLTPVEVWQAQPETSHYSPEDFEREGFVHCTDDSAELIAVGNRYYRNDGREYVCLVIACDDLEDPVIYEDANRMFPHIYGPVPRRAVRAVRSVSRDGNGRFIAVLGD